MPENDNAKLARLTASAKGSGLSDISSKPLLMLPCEAIDAPTPKRQSQYLPCDAVSMKLDSKIEDGNASVRCTDHAYNDRSLTASEQTLLAGDDLLLQITAGCYDGTKSAPKPAKVNIEGETSPSCPISRHKHFILRRRTSDLHKQAQEIKQWIKENVETQEFLARPIDPGSGNEGYFKAYWPYGQDRVSAHHILLLSCGIKDGAAPVGSLTGRIEIYPDDKYSLSYEVPEYFKDKRSGGHDAKLQLFEKDKDQKNRLNPSIRTSSESSHEISKDGKSEKESASSARTLGFSDDYVTKKEKIEIDKNSLSSERSEGVKNNKTYIKEKETEKWNNGEIERTLTLTDSTTGTPTAKYEENSAEKEIAAVIKFSRNDNEIEINKIINNLINISNRIKKIFDELNDFIPKIGYTWSISLDVCKGSINAEWGIRTRSKRTHARIWEVEKYGTFTVKLEIVKLSLSAGFGVDYKIENWLSAYPAVELVLKIEIKFDVAWALETSFTISETYEADNSTKPDTKVKAQAVGRASLLGISMFAQAEAKTGIEGEAKLKSSVAKAPTLRIKGELKPLKVAVTHKTLFGRPKTDLAWQYPTGGEGPSFEKILF